jgi:putative ABC transport system permease protein
MSGPSRLLPMDLARLAVAGLRLRRSRASLSALGVAIGTASMVAVIGISESSRAGLIAALDRLGTNLLRVAPGTSFAGEAVTLPSTAVPMIGRLRPVERVAAIRTLDRMTVRRTDLVAPEETGGIFVAAADVSVMRVVRGEVAGGRFLDRGTARLPTVVLGSVAARRLGVRDIGVNVWIRDRWFTVIGVLEPVVLAPELDQAALIGRPASETEFGAGGSPTTVYVRADPEDVLRVSDLLPRAANPEHPEHVSITRPSDVLAARAAAQTALSSLLIGLGSVALIVGGVGIANVMVISVLERRSEIGLRRALGATRRHVALQFLSEAVALSAAGGLGGMVAGAVLTFSYAGIQGWEAVLPPQVIVGAVVGAGLFGAVAGLYPAIRAARLSPTEALRSV